MKISFLVASIIIFLQPFALAEDSHHSNFSERHASDKTSEAAITLAVEDGTPAPLRLILEQCLKIALEQNRKRTVSALSVNIAEYQHKQALSAYWPRLMLNSSYSRLDEDVKFIFPEETSNYSASQMN